MGHGCRRAATRLSLYGGAAIANEASRRPALEFAVPGRTRSAWSEAQVHLGFRRCTEGRLAQTEPDRHGPDSDAWHQEGHLE